MRILGIDPGVALMGYGLVHKKHNALCMEDLGVIRTRAGESLSERYMQVHRDLRAIIERHKPDEIAIETLFFGKNKKTGILVSEARGVILLTCAQAGIKIYEYTPLQIKKGLTGYGQATKDQVMRMITLIFQLEKLPEPDDAADALAVAVCHAHHNQKLTHTQ